MSNITEEEYRKSLLIVQEYQAKHNENMVEAAKKYHRDYLSWAQRAVEGDFDIVNYDDSGYDVPYYKKPLKVLYIERPSDYRMIPPGYLDDEWDELYNRIKREYPADELAVTFGVNDDKV